MDSAIGKLLEVAGSPLSANLGEAGTELIARFGANGETIRRILAIKNGFFCFESALRFFPYFSSTSSWGLEEWNSTDLWKCDYKGLADGAFCFAEDIFGKQFCLENGGVCEFDPESADTEVIASTIDEWATKILEDFNVMTGYGFAHEWQKKHGSLAPKARLMAKTPFVLGGKYGIDNFVAIDSVRLMKNLGNLARQIHDLPDGSQITFQVLQ